MSAYFPVTLAASLLTTHPCCQAPKKSRACDFFWPDYKSYTVAHVFCKVFYNRSLPGRV